MLLCECHGMHHEADKVPFSSLPYTSCSVATCFCCSIDKVGLLMFHDIVDIKYCEMMGSFQDRQSCHQFGASIWFDGQFDSEGLHLFFCLKQTEDVCNCLKWWIFCQDELCIPMNMLCMVFHYLKPCIPPGTLCFRRTLVFNLSFRIRKFTHFFLAGNLKTSKSQDMTHQRRSYSAAMFHTKLMTWQRGRLHVVWHHTSQNLLQIKFINRAHLKTTV